MAVIDGRTWLEHMSDDDCWTALALDRVGRLGVLVDSAPEIYPVNFVVHERSIVFRTDPGSKLRGLDRSPSVCFEVDRFDLRDRAGYSVLIKGTASEVTDPEELREVAALPLRFWPLGEKGHWIRIHPNEVTGRRVHRSRSLEARRPMPVS